jgi:GntR family transcriptional regulator
MTKLTRPPRDRRPLPQQLRDLILATIRDEGMRAGDQLPAEAVIAERFQMGRSTVREAMKLLERDGLIEVQHGRGSFVSAVADLGSERPITRLEGVTEMMTGLGYSVENRVLGVQERLATESERVELALADGSTVVDLERLRLHEGQPFIYSRNAFARDLLDAQLHEIDWSRSLLELLASIGHNPVSSAAHIRAVETPPRLLSLGLDVPTMPWLLITETCISVTGDPILHAQDFHRSDIFAFHVIRRRSGDG